MNWTNSRLAFPGSFKLMQHGDLMEDNKDVTAWPKRHRLRSRRVLRNVIEQEMRLSFAGSQFFGYSYYNIV